MIYKQYNNGSYHIHTIQTNRFKSVRMEIIFRNNIDIANIAKRTCLFETLMESSETYPTHRQLALKLEELYNAVCYAVSSRVGNQAITSVIMEFLNPRYAEENFLNEAIKLPFDLLFHPHVSNKEFSNVTLEQILAKMEAEIKSINENPQQKAIKDALKFMDPHSVSSSDLMGSLDDLAKITPANLYETYEDVMLHDYVDIFIIGDIDMNKALDIINKYALFTTIKNHELTLNVSHKISKKVKKTIVPSSYAQSQIVMILNTLNLKPDERRYAFVIYNMILGGGSLETKLYQYLRDKNSLCYNIRSMYQKNDNLVIISTAVDKKNTDKAIKLIKQVLAEMVEGQITNEELERAKKTIITAINMSLDQPGRIIDNYLFQYISDLESNEVRIAKYQELTLNDIKEVANKVRLNTIYVLEAGDKHEKD